MILLPRTVIFFGCRLAVRRPLMTILSYIPISRATDLVQHPMALTNLYQVVFPYLYYGFEKQFNILEKVNIERDRYTKVTSKVGTYVIAIISFCE